jgi:hypothetical protein
MKDSLMSAGRSKLARNPLKIAFVSYSWRIVGAGFLSFAISIEAVTPAVLCMPRWLHGLLRGHDVKAVSYLATFQSARSADLT